MKLDSCTPAQRESITHVNGPLLISAGAGSGKTFTLQQRIVYAFLPESGPALSSIDELLAITFTEKAAGEIKSRVRSALREAGLTEEALRVDDAWISTIHGMGSRILHEHALELGINPDFRLIDGIEEDDLRLEALSQTLTRFDDGMASESGITAEELGDFINEYGTNDYSSVSVASMVAVVLTTAAKLSRGLDAFELGPVGKVTPQSLAHTMMEACEDALEAPLGPKAREAVEANLSDLEAYLALPAENQDNETFEDLLRQLVKPRVAGKDEAKEAIRRVQYVINGACVEYNLSRGAGFARTLLGLARLVQQQYEKLLISRGCLDMNGLLTMTLRALRDHPSIAESYRNRFKLVMVDEFQDTNQLQIDIIECITGARRQTLCTVGDSQQSIYRFLGADVSVYRQHKRDMTSPETGARQVALDKNFRSHGDILAFVRRVCGQPNYFVEPFLDLQPGRDEQRLQDKGRQYKGKRPRVSVNLTTYPSRNVSVVDAKTAEAEAIAQWFADLRNAGHAPGEMALLMGVTTHIQLYAEALRRHGLSCVFSGGSKFYEASEVKLLANLLRALAEPHDTEALFAVLTGEMMTLSADDLLLLSTQFPDEDEPEAIPLRCNLDVKLVGTLPENASAPLRFAADVLRRGWSAAGYLPPSQVVRQVIADSGWLARLQAEGVEGQAKAANIFKALGIMADIEREAGFDIARVSVRFNALMGGKESAGTLVGKANESVRLMTVHGSKGLEFPLVAVADCYKPHGNGSALEMLTAVGTEYLSLDVKESRLTLGSSMEFLDEETKEHLTLDSASTLGEFRAALKQRQNREDLEEQRRLFYVAITRASEALLVSCTHKVTRENRFEPVQDDLQWALFGEGGFPEESGTYDYGGSEPLIYTLQTLEAEGDEASDANVSQDFDTAEVTIIDYPVLEDHPSYPRNVLPKPATGLVSYSSLASHEPASEEADHDWEGEDVIRKLDGEKASSHESGQTEQLEYDRENIGKTVSTQAKAFAADENFTVSDEVGGEVSARPITYDADKATDFGSALHRLCQLAALTDADTARASLERMVAIYQLKDADRLQQALECWLGSKLCAKAFSFAAHEPEVPFCIKLSDTVYLEGEIDLLCYDVPDTSTTFSKGGKRAFIVDYKTGGSPEEALEQLQAKHQLQARCYAYATLVSGYDQVELHFVRVEQADKEDPSQPEVVDYVFTAADIPDLLATIRSLC